MKISYSGDLGHGSSKAAKKIDLELENSGNIYFDAKLQFLTAHISIVSCRMQTAIRPYLGLAF